MEMALIPQFMDEEQMLEYGVDLRAFGITRDDMLHDSKITLDTSYGATNNMARRQMATTLYFGLQQRIKYMLSLGAKLPPKDLWGPVEMFDKLMVMSGERGIRRYSSSQEEVVAYNKAIVERQMKDYQQQAQQTQQLEETILDEARMAGENAAMQQMTPAQEAQQ
jgi:hypothetical protein